MRLLISGFVCFITSGCVSNILDGDHLRGNFTLVASSDAEQNFVKLSTDPVKSKACFNVVKTQLYMDDVVFETAVRRAIDGFDGATVLMDVSIEDKGQCVYVTGYPGRER